MLELLPALPFGLQKLRLFLLRNDVEHALTNINSYYPECSFISKSKILPLSILFGKPKIFQSFHSTKDIHDYNLTLIFYNELLEEIEENREARTKFWNLFNFKE